MCSCHKCGMIGHLAHACRISKYLIKIFQENKKLRAEVREVHTMDASMDSIGVDDLEAYMTNRTSNDESNDALIDSATTHTILRDRRFFIKKSSTWQTKNMMTMAGANAFCFQEGTVMVKLPAGSIIKCKHGMFAPSTPRSLITYRDVRINGYHLSTVTLNRKEVLVLTKNHEIVEKAFATENGLYRIAIRPPIIFNFASSISESRVSLWHGRLGHPRSTLFRKIIRCITGHNLKPVDVDSIELCRACVQGKMITRPSIWKLPQELPPMLERLHGDICGPINPILGPFRYFLVLVDTSGKQSHISLLSTRNMVFANLISMLIRFRAHFPDYPIKTLYMDNAKEFASKSFEDYCTATGIELTYCVPYEHAQNGLAESFIKHIQLIMRPLLLHANLPSSMWGHAVLHVVALICLRPSSLETVSPHELISGHVPNVSHLQVFGCRTWIPIPKPQRRTIGAHRQEDIYVGFDSPSIIRIVDPSIGTLLRARL